MPAVTSYVTVLLPLALSGHYTYRLPAELADRVEVGSRVVVQFGARRYYTAIVVRLHTSAPEVGVKYKEVSDVVDPRPIVTAHQLYFWQWLSDYYLCTPGEVMKAALPSGLKLESETRLICVDDYVPEAGVSLTEAEWLICRTLGDADKGLSLQELEKKVHLTRLLHPVRHLMDLGAVAVRESLVSGFKPRTETHVRLSDDYVDEGRLNAFLERLHRAPARERLLLRYLDLSQAHAALTLHNATLLKEVSRQALCAEPGSDAALNALRKEGVLTTYPYVVQRIGVTRPTAPGTSAPCLGSAPLNDEQQRAHDEIVRSFATRPVCLLCGVTSSGKTQVYIRLIEETIRRGRQVLYLLPEIALTTQITDRLSRVFGDRMGVYHSKFPDAERVELWQHQLGTAAYPLILGVRSSLFLPYHDLGLIIVDEEHEMSYKQQDPAPRYNARDAAIVLARRYGANVLLGTATPSVNSYHNAQQGRYGLVRMLHRYGGVEMPRIEVADVKELRRKKLMNTPFSPRLIEEVRRALAHGEQAIIFQNRRGWSPVIECRTCGWTPRCTRCDVSLTYHRGISRLVCHYCGAAYSIPTVCPACGGTELRDMGYGTERIEEYARKLFPDARIARMDLDTTRSRTAYERIIHDFSGGETNLLIGTQMVTKGLDFGRVSVVGILSADQLMSMPDYRATERAYQMMAQVAGRAGRRGRQGLVILQTRRAEAPVIGQVVREDYETLYEGQMAERTAYHYPPVYRLISIYLKHRDDTTVSRAAESLATLLRPHFGDDLLGPERPVVSRVQLQFIRKLMLKVRPDLPPSGVRRTLLAARDVVLAEPAYKGVNLYFDVDP